MDERPADDSGQLMDSAPRRTWLAAERTFLAWLRTAFAALALAIAVGRLLPALVSVSHVAFGVVGAAYGVFGVMVLLVGAYRTQRVRGALTVNRPLPTDMWTVWLLTIIGLALAVATIVLIFVEV
jgi:putative membrane protein